MAQSALQRSPSRFCDVRAQRSAVVRCGLARGSGPDFSRRSLATQSGARGLVRPTRRRPPGRVRTGLSLTAGQIPGAPPVGSSDGVPISAGPRPGPQPPPVAAPYTDRAGAVEAGDRADQHVQGRAQVKPLLAYRPTPLQPSCNCVEIFPRVSVPPTREAREPRADWSGKSAERRSAQLPDARILCGEAPSLAPPSFVVLVDCVRPTNGAHSRPPAPVSGPILRWRPQ